MTNLSMGASSRWKIHALFLLLTPVLPAEQAAPSAPPSPASAPSPTAQPAAPAKPGPPAPAPAPTYAPLPGPSDKAASKHGDYTNRVVVIPVGKEDLILPARFEFMSRTLKRASEEGAEAVIFDLDTPGGLAWETSTLMMKDLEKLSCRSISFVNPRAMSAGALIAIATDAIYMGPVSSIGAATPVNMDMTEMGKDERSKLNSGFMGMARSVAVAKGHNPTVVEAMIDREVEVKIGDQEIHKKGVVLTLDQKEATTIYDGKPLLAKGIVKDLAELRQREGLKGELITAEPKGFEKLAMIIAQYAAILLLIGLAAGYIEMQHPGMTIPGVIAAIAFGLFFFGHFIAGSLAGYETVVVFIIGILLLVVEFFFFPGHIIPGLVGLLMVLGALLYTMAGWDLTVPEGRTFPVNSSDYLMPMRNMGIALIGAIAVIAVAMRYLPAVGPFRRLVLHASVGGAQASIEGEAQALAANIKAGDTGTTYSALRPYGNVKFHGMQMEAMVEGDYLPPQTPVRVVAVQGGKVIVERA